MHLTVLGSGTGLIRTERYAPSFFLKTDTGTTVLIDCGWGSAVRIAEHGIDLQTLDHIVISHPHVDHTGNLMNLLQSMLISGYYRHETERTTPLHIHGYPGFAKDYETLRSIQFPERVEPFEIHVHEYHDETMTFGDLTITGKEVPHVPQYFKANAYRMKAGGKSLTYSGDCGANDTLIELAKDADLALFEMSVSPQTVSTEGPRPNHLSPQEAAHIAAQANAKQLVLWHNYDQTPKAEILKTVQSEFKGAVYIAEDGMHLKID
jgi:ribonuclease BN (tRNA processing enzyme)